MKAQINKSQVMKRAWSIFNGKNRDYNYSFSASLRRAWFVEKEALAYEQRKAQEEAEQAEWAERNRIAREESKSQPANDSAYNAGLIEYYRAGMGGRIYYGD